jgi:hypothetical protein
MAVVKASIPSFRDTRSVDPESTLPQEGLEKWLPGLARSLSSGAHSRDPLGLPRNDGEGTVTNAHHSPLTQ